MQLPYRLIPVLVSLMFVGTATAQSTSTSYISTISYRLVDLDLNDGITPSLSFVHGSNETGPSSFSVQFDNSGLFSSTFGAHQQDPITLGQVNGTASAHGTLTSNGSLDSLGLTVVANAAGDGSFNLKRATIQGSSGVTNFELSPMTAIVFTANSVLTGQTKQIGDWAVSSSWISLTTYVDGQPAYTQDYKSLNSAYDVPLGNGAKIETQQNTLLVGYANFSSGNSETSFSAGTFASSDSYSPAAPVPEPSVYAMLLAGMGLIAFVKRRRA